MALRTPRRGKCCEMLPLITTVLPDGNHWQMTVPKSKILINVLLEVVSAGRSQGCRYTPNNKHPWRGGDVSLLSSIIAVRGCRNCINGRGQKEKVDKNVHKLQW